MHSLGVLIHGATAPTELGPLAKLAEEHGFSEIWVSEDYFMLAGFSSAALVLHATQRAKVGLGVVASLVRHPAVTAMEVATLAAVFPERLRMGIGHGVPFWIQQMGLYPRSQLVSLREAVTSIRRLLAGETLTESGHFHFDAIQLHHPVDSVPLYTGVTGPKSLALSGEIADGTILSALAGPKYVAWAKQIIENSARQTHGNIVHELPTYVLYSVSPDRKLARRIARQSAAFYLCAMGPTALTDAYGLNDELGKMIEAGGAPIVEKEMPEAWLDWLTVSGEPDECVERIKALYAAGASSVIVAPMAGESVEEQIRITAKHVLPHL